MEFTGDAAESRPRVRLDAVYRTPIVTLAVVDLAGQAIDATVTDDDLVVEPAVRGQWRLPEHTEIVGIPVKQPDDRDGDLVVLIEVERPEGIVLCALAGRDYPDDAPLDSHAHTCNAASEQERHARATTRDMTGGQLKSILPQ